MSSLVITLEEDVIDKPLQPVGNYILVKMFAAVSRTAGGIVLPDEVGTDRVRVCVRKHEIAACGCLTSLLLCRIGFPFLAVYSNLANPVLP